ncbi:acyl-CoA carboxylase subunit epsilon [Streptomyces beihaiensis]|uniref:Acyl-CoA carboxylase subunit epsilon n=1 Tax=Streptomyces beihaiensis TaxID=2984495 RepID=A0ABT3TYM6_9ACTN|nr:acyl-CoA carboxylase subunit epsilon [Streptomyces beihaiensis]MCX3062152.1 acyl-CoA carboxylase subunit epsilon [Streptomyces beihaiensis]
MPDVMPDAMPDAIRVERGKPGPEELAVITAVLLARIRNGDPAPSADGGTRRDTARWSLPERLNVYRNPGSWQRGS